MLFEMSTKLQNSFLVVAIPSIFSQGWIHFRFCKFYFLVFPLFFGNRLINYVKKKDLNYAKVLIENTFSRFLLLLFLINIIKQLLNQIFKTILLNYIASFKEIIKFWTCRFAVQLIRFVFWYLLCHILQLLLNCNS